MAWAAVSLIVVMLSDIPLRVARAASQIAAEPCVALRHLGDRGLVVDAALQPGPRRVAEDGAADRETLDQMRCRAASAKEAASSSSGASRPSTTMPRRVAVVRLDGRLGRSQAAARA